MKIVLDLRKLLVGLFAFYVCYTFCNNDLYGYGRLGSNMVISFIILLSAGMTIMFMNQFKILFDNIYIKCYTGFSFYLILSYVWTNYRVHQFYIVPFIICNFLLIGLFWNVAQYIDLEKMLEIFILAGCLAATKMLITVPAKAYGFLVVFDGIGNRNILGMCLSFSASICFVMLLIKKNIVYLGIMVYLYYAAMMAGSKKGILMGGLIITVFVLMMRFSWKKVSLIMLTIFLGIIVFYILMNNTFIYEIIGTRMQMFIRSLRYGGEEDLSTRERMILLRFAFQAITERPIFGWGTNGFTGWVARFTNWRATYSHNNYTEVWSNFGIVGLGIYYTMYILIMRNGIKINHISKENYASILGTATIITLMILEMASVTYYDIFSQMIIMFAVVMIYWYGEAN